MTQQELDEIKRRCDSATPGPWRIFNARAEYRDFPKKTWGWKYPWMKDDDIDSAWEMDGGYDGYGISEQDASFCANAREDIPRLLETVAQLRAEVKLLRKRLRRVRDENYI